MKNTMSIYDALAIVILCFDALGDAGRTLAALAAVMREWVKTLEHCAEVDNRIYQKRLAAGMIREVA